MYPSGLLVVQKCQNQSANCEVYLRSVQHREIS